MIRAAATDLLDVCRAAYTSQAAEACGVDVPTTSLVTHAAPAWDGDLLAVATTNLTTAYQGRCSVVYAVRLTVWVVRCVPVTLDNGSPPDPADVEAAALTLADDAWLLTTSIADAAYSRSLFPSFDGIGCEQVRLGDGRAEAPSGGLAGWSLPITVDLSGAVLSG